MLNELQVLEVSNERVLTTKQLAEIYETETDRIKQGFNRNKKQFTEGVHFHKLQGTELKEFKTKYLKDTSLKKVNCLYLWTERGANRHCKILDTDKAWQQFDVLEDTYFNQKQTLPDPPPMSMEDIMIYSLQEMKNVKLQLETQGKEIETTKNEIRDIRDAIVVDTKDWRKWINDSIKKLAETEILIEEFGNLRYQSIRAKTYKELEIRANCKLKTRLKNIKERLEKAGLSKTRILRTSYLEVIEQDKKLKEIYTMIVKEMLVKYQSIA